MTSLGQSGSVPAPNTSAMGHGLGGRRARAALAGVLAGTAGLAAGELVAGMTDWRSPVVAVGNKVIDKVPPGVKDFAISTFGKNDKRALVVGILVLVGVYSAAVGVLGARRRAWAIAGAVGLGLVGVGTAASGRAAAGGDVVPSLVATAVAAAVLLGLLRVGAPVLGMPGGGALLPESPESPEMVASPPADRSSDPTEVRFPVRPVDRRRFLGLGVATAGAAAGAGWTGRWLQRRGEAVAVRKAVVLPAAKAPLPPVPAAATADVAAMTPFLTPNDQFYRIDTAIFVPRVDSATWKLEVNGLVRRPLTLTYDDLLRRDLVEADCTLMCVSNAIGGDLIGTARWLGVPLRELLDEAGVKPEGTQIVGVSVDGFTAGFPTKLAMDGRDALVAVGMNGEPLPFAHGYPARLVVPGIYGYVSATKWLSEIRVTRWEDFDGYWIPRGWSKEAPIKTGSRIDVPRKRRSIVAGPTPIAGIAWAQRRGVSKVEVQIDDEPWREATLAAADGVDTWRQWHLLWDATAGEHGIRVRATDGKGVLQTAEVALPEPDGATGWHTILVQVG